MLLSINQTSFAIALKGAIFEMVGLFAETWDFSEIEAK